eukprot:SAG11_NODE_23299_length_391_cov_0.972603_1_plen_65_part_10
MQRPSTVLGLGTLGLFILFGGRWCYQLTIRGSAVEEDGALLVATLDEDAERCAIQFRIRPPTFTL